MLFSSILIPGEDDVSTRSHFTFLSPLVPLLVVVRFKPGITEMTYLQSLMHTMFTERKCRFKDSWLSWSIYVYRKYFKLLNCEKNISCTKRWRQVFISPAFKKCPLQELVRAVSASDSTSKVKQKTSLVWINVKHSLLASNIPFNNFTKPSFKNFLRIYYLNQNIQDELTLRENWVQFTNIFWKKYYMNSGLSFRGF